MVNPISSDLSPTGRVILDSATGACFWMPSLPRYSNRGFWERKGYQLIQARPPLLLPLIGTFARLVLVHPPDFPTPEYFAPAADVAFCTAVPVALAFPLRDSFAGPRAPAEGLVLLPDQHPLPPPSFGTLGLILESGTGDQPGVLSSLNDLGANATLVHIQLQKQLRRLKAMTIVHATYQEHWTHLHLLAQRLANEYWLRYQDAAAHPTPGLGTS